MIYEYQCKNGHYFEKNFRIGQADKTAQCPCGAMGEKIFSSIVVSNGEFGMNMNSFEREYIKEENVRTKM